MNSLSADSLQNVEPGDFRTNREAGLVEVDADELSRVEGGVSINELPLAAVAIATVVAVVGAIRAALSQPK